MPKNNLKIIGIAIILTAVAILGFTSGFLISRAKAKKTYNEKLEQTTSSAMQILLDTNSVNENIKLTNQAIENYNKHLNNS